MADQINGSTPVRPKTNGWARPIGKNGQELDIRYLPVAASGTLALGTFVTIASGVLSEATTASTAIHGMTLNTNVTTWNPSYVIGLPVLERRPTSAGSAGVGVLSTTEMVEYAVADDALEFPINIGAAVALTAAMVGSTCDIGSASSRWFANTAATTTNVLRITRLIDPVGTVGGLVYCVINPAARQAA